MLKYIAILTILFFVLSGLPAHAAQLDAVIPKSSNEFVPKFQFTRIITIQYDDVDSKLAELMGETEQKISFDLNSKNSKNIIDLINTELKEKSFVKVTEISGEYTAIISPNTKSVGIEHHIVLYLTMKGRFIGNFETLDSQWRGFLITEDIPVMTKYGPYDINSPKSALEKTFPQAMQYISESDDVMEILDMPLIDASGISKLQLSEWESLFDPTALMSEKDRYGFSGNVITNYSMGICTIFGGICQDKIFEKEFVIDGDKYLIYSTESQDDATIILDGYVTENHLGTIETFTVLDNAPAGKQQNLELYVAAGVGVVVTVGFFVWSDRKTKKTSTEQTGIDPKDLRAVPIRRADVGSYQTNRGTAALAKK